MTQVFVYGTLKPGGCYYYQYCTDNLVGFTPALTRGRLYDFPQLGYPGMTPGEDWIHGYLLTFRSEQILSRLDWLEDYDPTRPQTENTYMREQATVFDSNYRQLTTAWVYRMTPERVQALSGIYLATGNWPIKTH